MNITALAQTLVKYGAPLLGAAIGTPSAMAIVQLISGAFGLATSDPADMINAIQSDPNAAVKLSQIESDQKVELQKLIIQHEQLLTQSAIESRRIDLENTESAREYNNKSRANAYFSMLLSFVIITSFYACIYWIAAYPQDANDHDVLYMLFGISGTAFGAVVNYWLGSSADKSHKPK